MRWLKIKKPDITLELCISGINNEPFIFIWTNDFLKLYKEGKLVYSFQNEPLLTCGEVSQLKRFIEDLLNQNQGESQVLVFSEPVFEFETNPDDEERFLKLTVNEHTWKGNPEEEVVFEATGVQHSVMLSRQEAEYLYTYLVMLDTHKDSRTEFKELFDRGIFSYGWRYCLVGNIIGKHMDEVAKREVIGTPRFTEGTKVYISPFKQRPLRYKDHDNYDVIGKLRKHKKFVRERVPAEYITNWRIQRVYKPVVLDWMDWSGWYWWGTGEKDVKQMREVIDLYVGTAKEGEDAHD